MLENIKEIIKQNKDLHKENESLKHRLGKSKEEITYLQQREDLYLLKYDELNTIIQGLCKCL